MCLLETHKKPEKISASERKIKMKDIEIKGSFDPIQTVDEKIETLQHGKHLGTLILKQCIENSADSGATEIQITMDHTENVIIIKDNGSGLGPDERKAYFSIHKSSKKDDPETSGKNGTGRVSVLAGGEEIQIEVVSRYEGEGNLKMILTRQTLYDVYSGKGRVLAKPVSRGFRAGTTGSIITISGKKINWHKVNKAEFHIRTLAAELLPEVAAMVTINGKSLEPVVSTDEMVKLEEIVLPTLGKIKGYLFFSQKNSKVRLCGRRNMISDLRTVMLELKKVLGASIPKELIHPNISGCIRIDNLNDYRGHNDSLNSEFIGGKAGDELLTYGVDILVPTIRKMVAIKESKRSDKLAAMFNEKTQALTHKAFGSVKKPRVKKVTNGKVHLDFLKAEMTPGEMLTLTVTDVPEGYSKDEVGYVLDSDDEKLSLSSKEGSSVVITAEKVGAETIFVYCLEDDDIFTEVRINVVDKKVFRIERTNPTLKRGGRIILRVVNVGPRTMVHWDLPDQVTWDSFDKYQHQIQVSAGKSVKSGEYEFSACTSSERSEGTLKIIKPQPKMSKGVIRIGDTNYVLKKAKYVLTQLVHISEVALTDEEPDEIEYSMEHWFLKSRLKGKSDPQVLEIMTDLLYPAMIRAHIDKKIELGEMGDGEMSDVDRRTMTYSTILKQLLGGDEEE